MSMTQEDGHVWVTLSLPEMLTASNIAVIRHYASTQKNSKAAYEFKEVRYSMLDIHILGAMGEVCVSKVLNAYFEGTVNTYKKPDIGTNIQARATMRQDGFLRVSKEDSPDDYYFLVTGTAPHFCVRGWLKGEDAQKKEQHFRSIGGRPPFFFIPQDELHPIQIQERTTWRPHDDATA